MQKMEDNMANLKTNIMEDAGKNGHGEVKSQGYSSHSSSSRGSDGKVHTESSEDSSAVECHDGKCKKTECHDGDCKKTIQKIWNNITICLSECRQNFRNLCHISEFII